MTLLYSKCGLSEPTGVARTGLFLALIFESDLKVNPSICSWSCQRSNALQS